MSEIMLQRSLSTSSLVKQAAAAVQAQQKEVIKRMGKRPGLERATTDYVAFPFSSRGVSHDNTSLFPSAISSGFVSPSGERKHIHFNEQVSQCIAVDIKGDEEDEEVGPLTYDSDSDEGAIMMKPTKAKKRRPTMRRAKSHSAATESKTIAMLPSTTLKSLDDSLETTETAMKHSVRSPVMSPSSSQETLRPSKKSGKLFFSEDSDDEDDDKEDEQESEDLSDSVSSGPAFGLQRSTSSGALSSEALGMPAGMRRTASGMLMPLEEDEPGGASEGLLGRVIDTVNTARDIAHVIGLHWWRK